jgi:hypothetical protein
MVNPKFGVHPSLRLYVDIDGVLHHQEVLWSARKGIYMCPRLAPGRSLFEWTHYLIEALDPYPNAQLVLSSSWCRKPGYGETMKRLPATLQARFIGGTFHRRVHGADAWSLSQFLALSRGQQVLQDVRRRAPGEWLALDDNDEAWLPEHLHNLVKCDGDTGLSSPSVRVELKEKLKRCNDALLGAAGNA